MQGKPTTVMFLHPGPECKPTRGERQQGVTDWNTKAHKRKYVEAKGGFLASLSSPPTDGIIGFWTEWEAPASIVRRNASPTLGLPTYIYEPLVPQVRPTSKCKNTDPCVFGNHFLYSNCQQYKHTKKGDLATALQNLEAGDVVIFGSRIGGEYVTDTVFVVRDAIRFNRKTARSTVVGVVPQWYYSVTLNLLLNEHVLYVGATHSSPYEGMFSFFPCVQANVAPNGFKRPATLRNFYNGQSRGFRYTNLPVPQTAWNTVVIDVLASGLLLGVNASI